MTIKDRKSLYAVRDGYWFAPKLFGIGATPVTWQGWALTLGFSAALIAVLRLMPGVIAPMAITIALLLVYLLITIQKTDGGWRWRWGRRWAALLAR